MVFNNSSWSSDQTLTDDIDGPADFGTWTFEGSTDYTLDVVVTGTGHTTIGQGSGGLILSDNLTLDNSSNTDSYIYIDGVGGSGNLSINSNGNIDSGSLGVNIYSSTEGGTFTGQLNLNSGIVQVAQPASVIGSATAITVANGATLYLNEPDGETLSVPITVSGSGYDSSWGAIDVDSDCAESDDCTADSYNITFSGAIILTGNTLFYGDDSGTITITGPLSGD